MKLSYYDSFIIHHSGIKTRGKQLASWYRGGVIVDSSIAVQPSHGLIAESVDAINDTR